MEGAVLASQEIFKGNFGFALISPYALVGYTTTCYVM